MNEPKTIKEVLNKLVQDPELKKYPHSYNPIVIERTLTDLYTLIEKRMPKESMPLSGSLEDRYGRLAGQRKGFNQYHSEMNQILKEIFER